MTLKTCNDVNFSLTSSLSCSFKDAFVVFFKFPAENIS